VAESLRQGRQGGQPLVPGVGVHRQPLKWQHLRFRQQVDGRVVAQPAQQVIVQAAGVFRARRDDQQRPLPAAGQRCYECWSSTLPDYGATGAIVFRRLDSTRELRVVFQQVQDAVKRHETVR